MNHLSDNENLAHPEEFEPPTIWFEARYSVLRSVKPTLRSRLCLATTREWIVPLKTDLIRFGLKGIQQPRQNGMGTKVGTYFTRQGSLVQIQPRPPFYSLYYCSLA